MTRAIKSIKFGVILLAAAIASANSYADDVVPTQSAKFRIGLDITYGAVNGAKDIYYGITDNYSNKKSSFYKYDDIIGAELAGALRFKHFETEGFVDYMAGGTQDAPNYYNYIRYPMDARGTIINLGVREHYYLPVMRWLDLDFGIGAGWGFNYGEFIDEYDIDYYRQDTWNKNSAFYDLNLGIVLNWSEHFGTRIGYRRTNYLSNKFGLQGINQGYAGISYTF